jgi:hypothetical protein
MAFFDSDHFDSGVRFDEAGPGKIKTMKKIIVTMDLAHKSDTELKQYAADHIAKTALSTAFPGLTAGAVAFQSLHDAFEAGLGVSDQAQKTAMEKTNLKDAARAALELGLTQRGHVCEGTIGVTADQVLAVGFGVKSDAAPAPKSGKVLNLSLTTGDDHGTIDAAWNRMPGAQSYEVQWCPDPFTDAGWRNFPGCTKSKTVLTGLTSGAKIWVRVRALGAAGPGAWSNEVLIVVP